MHKLQKKKKKRQQAVWLMFAIVYQKKKLHQIKKNINTHSFFFFLTIKGHYYLKKAFKFVFHVVPPVSSSVNETVCFRFSIGKAHSPPPSPFFLETYSQHLSISNI